MVDKALASRLAGNSDAVRPSAVTRPGGLDHFQFNGEQVAMCWLARIRAVDSQKMMTDTNIQITPVTIAEVLPLRDRMLRANLPAGDSELRSDRNADTLHLGARSGNELIGISTIAREDPAGVKSKDVWRLCGMAVNANLRGHGIGAALAEKCIDHAKLAGGCMVWCSARESAFGFYRSIGFELVGELYSRAEIAGERFARMARYLSC